MERPQRTSRVGSTWSALVGVLTLLFLTLVGCGKPPSKPADEKPLSVFAGIPPLAYLVEQIGRDHVTVDVLVQPSQDPHTFEPTPQQVLALGRASVFFKIDMPFESVLLDKITEGHRGLRVVDATHGIQKRLPDAWCCHTAAEHGHAAAAGQTDPHVWLSPPLLKTMAENIAAALRELNPQHEGDYGQNLDELLERIDATHQRIQQKLEPYRGRSFYVFHPGFGYFADAYGLKEEAVEVSGQAPTAKQLRALIAHARTDGVTTIFTQPQYAPQSAQKVAKAIGGKVVSINGFDKDVLADIEDIATKLETAFKESSPREEGKHEKHEGHS